MILLEARVFSVSSVASIAFFRIKLTDGRELYLEVTPSGGKHWRYRYRMNDKESTFVIGKYPRIGAAAARAKRDEARKLIDQGINPTHRLYKVPTTAGWKTAHALV